MGEGVKYDEGKPDYSLMPSRELEQIVKIMTHGRDKYGRNNWKGELENDRLYAALMRHLETDRQGEYLDKETGEPHLAHVACNAIFLLWYRNNEPAEVESKEPVQLSFDFSGERPLLSMR